MPDYTVVAPDGRELHLVGDKPPTREQVKGLFEHLAKQKTAATPTRAHHDVASAGAQQKALPTKTAKPPQKVSQISAPITGAPTAIPTASTAPRRKMKMDEDITSLEPQKQMIEGLIGMAGRFVQQHMPQAAGIGVGAPNLSGGIVQPHPPSQYSQALSRRPFMEQIHNQHPGGPLANINPDVMKELDAPSKTHGDALVKATIRGAMGLATVDNIAIGALLGPAAGVGTGANVIRAMASGYFGSHAAIGVKEGVEKYHKSGGKDKDALADAVVSGAFAALMAKHGIKDALEIRDVAMKNGNPVKAMTDAVHDTVMDPNAEQNKRPEWLKPADKPKVPDQPAKVPTVIPAEPEKVYPQPAAPQRAKAKAEPKKTSEPAAKKASKRTTLPGERQKPETRPEVPPTEIRPTEANVAPSVKTPEEKPDAQGLQGQGAKANETKTSKKAETVVEPKAKTAEVKPPEPTAHEKAVQDAHTKLENLKSPHAGVAHNEMLHLEAMGIDTSDARGALEEYKEIVRADYDTQEDYKEAREEAWENFIQTHGMIDATEVETPAEKPERAVKPAVAKKPAATPAELQRVETPVVPVAETSAVKPEVSAPRITSATYSTRAQATEAQKTVEGAGPVVKKEGGGYVFDQPEVNKPSGTLRRSAEYGSKNKGVKTDEAKAALERIRNSMKLGGEDQSLHSGLPLDDLIKLGAYHLEAGARTFAAWVKEMRVDLGEKFKDEHLQEIWAHLQKPEELPYTGARNKVTEPERTRRGLSDVERQDYIKIGDAFLLGKQAIEGGVDHHALASEVAAKPRVLSAEEVGTLAYGRRLIKNRYNALGVELDNAIAIGDKVQIKALQAELADVSAMYDANDQALVKGGREQSAAFAARKIIISDEGDYNDQLSQARRSAGRELTDKEKANIKSLTEEVKANRAQIDNLLKENAKKDAELAMNRIAEIARMDKRHGRIKDLAVERKSLIDALKDALAHPNAVYPGGLPVDVSIVLGKLAINYIKTGYHTLAGVVDKIQSDFPGGFEDRQIHDALSGYGRDIPKEAREEAKKIAELKKEAKLTSQTEDEPEIDTSVEQKPSETDNPHIISMRDELREYRKQRDRAEQIEYIENQLREKEIVRKPGDKSLYPKSADETKLAELKADYKEAQNVIDLHERIEAEKRGYETRTGPAEKREHSDEYKSLQSELAEYNKQRDAKKAIAELQKNLAADDIERRAGKLKDRPRTEDADKLAELKKEYSTRQSQLERIDDLHDQIEDLTGRLNRSEIEPKTTAKNEPKPEAETRLAELKAEYRRRQSELPEHGRIADLRNKLRSELEGYDARRGKARIDPLKREHSPEEKSLRQMIARERKLRDLNEEIRILETQYREGILKGPIKTEVKVDPKLQYAFQRKAFISAKIKAALKGLEPKSGLDRIVDYGRAVKLAGVGIFAKLAGASAWTAPIETLANALSVPFGKLKVKGQSLSSIAEREGQFSFKTEGLGYRKMFSREAVNNARDVFKSGFNSIHAEAGAEIHGNDLASMPGRMHGVVKSFLQTGEFNKAFEYRMNRAAEQARSNGEAFDPNDPDTITRIGYGAAMDAQSIILQGDNALSSAITSGIAAVERAGENRSPVSDVGAKIGAAFLRTLTPITRVPANYLGKAVQSTGLGLIEGAVRHAKAQMSAEPLSPKEADNIIRAYKYGGLGLVAAYIGLTQPPWFKAAGFYPNYRKGTTTNKNRKGEEMNPSELELAGVRIPHQIAHSPMLEAIQFWSTVKRGTDQQKHLIGIGEAAKGMAQQAPGLESVSGMGEALLGSGFDPSGMWGDYVRGMVEPQAANELAKYQDIGPKGIPNPRENTGFMRKIQAGIPDVGQPAGLRRKDLPLKGASKAKTAIQKQIDMAMPKVTSPSSTIRDFMRKP